MAKFIKLKFNFKDGVVTMRFKKFFAALVFILIIASCASAHELTIKPKHYNYKIKAGEPVEFTVQSAHKFIVPEEVEVLERVKAGIFADGKLQEAKLSGNDKDLCIDFTVTPKDDKGALILTAIKDGETWSITNEGGKTGARAQLEAQGLKVLRAAKNDKYAKAIFNSSHEDINYKIILNQPLEIIPLDNPADIKAGDYFNVKILLNGQPYSGPVWATYDGFVTEYENTYAYYTEAENGEAHIKITAPGFWGVRAYQGGLPGKAGDYDALTLRAFLLFEIK